MSLIIMTYYKIQLANRSSLQYNDVNALQPKYLS